MSETSDVVRYSPLHHELSPVRSQSRIQFAIPIPLHPMNVVPDAQSGPAPIVLTSVTGSQIATPHENHTTA